MIKFGYRMQNSILKDPMGAKSKIKKLFGFGKKGASSSRDDTQVSQVSSEDGDNETRDQRIICDYPTPPIQSSTHIHREETGIVYAYSHPQEEGPQGMDSSYNPYLDPYYAQERASSYYPQPNYPQGGSSSYYPQGGSSSYYPQGGSSSYYPQGGSSSYYPQEASSSYYPQEASSSYYPQEGSSSYYPQEGSSSYYPQEGSYPQDGSSSYYPYHGTSSNYPYQGQEGSSSYYGTSSHDENTNSCSIM
ncbi:uncharacterized protein LOC130724952 [Lotus japonicus]|uniref:uncharacterized protein LOC130724952 n=1 Tax=Lotus japonicus TaxID=34305 RepID=UPI0025833E56|nr:uncharacterized protein LOC130724952 [Lotus japonicus]